MRASGPYPHCGSEDHQLTSYERTSASVVLDIVVAVVCNMRPAFTSVRYVTYCVGKSIHVPLRVREVKYIVVGGVV